MPAAPQNITVDIISDIVCPWCVIGYHQLARAAELDGITLDVRWHPFELNPAMPEAGEDLREHLAAKYGTTPEGSQQARARLTELGQALGFTFNYADDSRIWNTFKAHQLIAWAQEQGRGLDMKLALFKAVFTDRKTVSDTSVLVDIARQAGFDAEAAQQLLESGERQVSVRQEEQLWIDRGITGVPAMVFHADQLLLVQGAQGEDNYRKVLAEVRERLAKAPAPKHA